MREPDEKCELRLLLDSACTIGWLFIAAFVLLMVIV